MVFCEPLANEIRQCSRKGVAGSYVRMAIGPHDEDWDFVKPLRKVIQELERGIVGPVKILIDEHHRLYPCTALDKLAHAVQQIAPLLFGRECDRIRDIRKTAAKLRQQSGYFGCILPERVPQVLGADDPNSTLELLDSRLVGWRTFHVQAVSYHDQQSQASRLFRGFINEPAFSHTGFTTDQYHRTGGFRGSLCQLLQTGELRRSPDKGRRLVWRQNPADLLQPGDFEQAPAHADAFQLEFASVLELSPGRTQHAIYGF